MPDSIKNGFILYACCEGIMERMKRYPGRFEPLELFSALVQVHDYDVKNNGHENDIIQRVRTSFNAARQNPVMLENLFRHVCAALNHCLLPERKLWDKQ